MNSVSLNHLVGRHDQRLRNGDAEHPGGLGVDEQFALDRLRDRQVRRFEDATSIDAEVAS